MTTFTSDIDITKTYPGVLYDASEIGFTYFEDREVDGVMYRVQNATFSGTTWSQKNPSKPSYAMTQNADGSISSFAVAAGTSSWSTWGGNGQRGVFNVRDFNAKGDGTTDDTAAIMAAVSAIPTSGGVLYFPAGTYIISSVISVPSYTLVLGAGYAFTTIRASSSYTGHNWMINNVGAGGTTGTIVAYDIYVRDLTVDGNGAVNTTSGKGLITMDGVYRCGVSDCQVLNSREDGIRVSLQGDTSKPWPGGVVNYFITNNRINLNQAGGISAQYPIRCLGASGGIISGNIIGDTTAAGSTNDSIGPAGCSNMVIANNNIFNGGDGINSMACYDVVIANNGINNPGGYGISTFNQTASPGLAVSRITITGNVITSAGKAGIRVVDGTTAGTAHDYVVSNNVLSGPGMAPDAIHIEANDGVVSGNVIDLQSGANDGIGIQGSFCHCIDNQVWNGGTGSHGINLGVSTPVDHCSIIGNHVHGIPTPLNTILTNLTACVIRGNVGINPYGAVTAPTISTATITNTSPFDCMVYIAGGNGVGVTLQGTSTGLGTGIGYLVPAGGTIKLSYSSAPTGWVWIAN